MSLYSEVAPLVECPRCDQVAIPMYAQPTAGFIDRSSPIVGVQYNAYCHANGCEQGLFGCRTDEALSWEDFDGMQALLADVTDGSVFGQLRNAGRQMRTRRVVCIGGRAQAN